MASFDAIEERQRIRKRIIDLGPRHLSRGLNLLLWSLRVYVLAMLTIVVMSLLEIVR